MSDTFWTILGPGTKPGTVRCRCRCGTERDVFKHNVRHGISKSCGCYKAQVTGDRARKHGHSRDHITGGPYAGEYSAWMSLKKRCRGTAGAGSKRRYKNRGIKVCERWIGPDGFVNFLADMGPRPSSEHSVDRKNNDGDYEPTNCRWATRDVQRRNCSRVVLITINGESLCQKDWAARLGVSYDNLRYRCKTLGNEQGVLFFLERGS